MDSDARAHRSGATRAAPARLRIALAVLATVVLSAACTSSSPGPGSAAGGPLPRQLFGAFLGSDRSGVDKIAGFEAFLGGVDTGVGHTYLPGDSWDDVEGPAAILGPWSRWKAQRPDDLFVLNVPMAAPDEAGLGDQEVASMLRQGASGAFDRHFATLAARLVDRGLGDAVLVLGWEMNGTTYAHRCGPDPGSWKQYFRRVVTVMRTQPGQRFRFDFTVSRGPDDVGWPQCYPGDEVVDVIGMDTYDQPPGQGFADYVNQPDGLQAQVDFAATHGKPVSYPEWGLFSYGDDPQFVADLHDWITTHNTVYSTLTDYCPHGVWECTQNPRSARAVQELFGRAG